MTANLFIDRVLDRLPRGTPRREQIATELRGHIAERAASGQPEADILRQLGDPAALAESYLTAVPLVAASFGRRAAAKAIDVVMALAFILPLSWVSWTSLLDVLGPFAPVLAILAVTSLFGVATALAEWQFGQTPGKALLGLWVVRESGARIGAGQAFVRQLPVYLEVFWIDVLFALFTERSQRAFELLTKTRVVVLR